MAAGLVSQHQLISYASPVNGGAGDATVVLSNDNTTVTGYNGHDADGTIHLQSSTAAVFATVPAGTAGRKWLTSDGLRVFYDTGSVWSEVNYLCKATGGTVAASLTVTGLLTAQLGLTVTGAVANVTANLGIKFGAENAGIFSTGANVIFVGDYATGAKGMSINVSTGATTFSHGTTVTTGGLTITAGGLTVTAGGLTVSAGTTAVQALTATTGAFSGLLSANAGLTVASGQTLTLTGATVAGTPTWSSSQAITLSTASQPNVTTLGGLTSVSSLVGFGGTTSSFPALKRSSTSLLVRLADDSADAALQVRRLTATETDNTGVLFGITSTTLALTLTTNPPLVFPTTGSISGLASGMMWFDGTDVKFRVGSTTKTFTLT